MSETGRGDGTATGAALATMFENCSRLFMGAVLEVEGTSRGGEVSWAARPRLSGATGLFFLGFLAPFSLFSVDWERPRGLVTGVATSANKPPNILAAAAFTTDSFCSTTWEVVVEKTSPEPPASGDDMVAGGGVSCGGGGATTTEVTLGDLAGGGATSTGGGGGGGGGALTSTLTSTTGAGSSLGGKTWGGGELRALLFRFLPPAMGAGVGVTSTKLEAVNLAPELGVAADEAAGEVDGAEVGDCEGVLSPSDLGVALPPFFFGRAGWPLGGESFSEAASDAPLLSTSTGR